MEVEPVILYVDDEEGVRRLVKLELGAQGFRVLLAESAEQARDLIAKNQVDLILLDLMMPGEGGLEFMIKLRKVSNKPVIIVTARDKDTDEVRGLELGADDYIKKPFNPDVVGARIRAVLRRNIPEKGDVNYRFGEVEINLTQRLVSRDGQPLALTRTEWVLLSTLAENAGKVMLNTELLTKVWGPEYRDDYQYLRNWISRLRAKLEIDPKEPKMIKTLQGIGYYMELEQQVEKD